MASYFISLNNSRSILQPRMQTFAMSLAKAIEEWNTGLGTYHTILDEFCRGVIINRMWYEYSSQALRSDKGIMRVRKGNRSYYVIDGRLTLRFKHVDESYRSWNYPTARSLAWNAQAPLNTIPRVVKLELGYRLDVTGTVVRDAVVMFNSGGRSVWRWQIWGYPISEFAAVPRDMFGDLVYVHDDYSTVVP